MRNLRKYFAVFVAVALLLTAIAPAFAADTAPAATTAPALTDAKICATVGMLVGDGSGVTDAYLASTPSKLQSAIMFLRLKNLEKEATAFKGTENFKDADKVDWDAGKAILAYLKANPKLGFVGNPDGTFDPNALITPQQIYKIYLVGLGYEEGKDFKYDDTIKFAEGKGLKKIAAVTKMTINDVAIATVEALKAATAADPKKTLIQALVDAKAIDAKKAQDATLIAGSGPATSFDLKVASAKTLYAKLNGVVADTSKVTVTVTRDAGIKAELTATWDKDKAGVTLAGGASLVAGEYKVAIKDDKTDLGSKTATVEAEKLAKIEMISKTITRRSDSDGVAYYKVTNQYGDDVTKLPIASNITWNSSLGTANGASISADKGILTFHKNDNTSDALTVYMGLLKDQQSVVVTAYDSDSNVVMNDSLTVSSTIGDIQSLKLLGLVNKDKKTALEKATTEVFYLDFEAKDSNGNLVTDYEIFRNTNAFRLSPGTQTESTIAYAEVVQDPNDNKQAKIQVKVPATGGIAGTQVISAVSITTGKNATMNVEVKEGAVLQQFVLQKPSQDVAVYDGYVEVPYIATDSNGNVLTDYSKIKKSTANTNGVTLSGVADYKEIQNPDGSYKLLVNFGDTKTTITMSATVTTSTTVKMSTMSVSVKDAAAPKTFVKLDSKAFVNAMVYGATVGDKLSKVTITDQYDRPLDLRFRSNRFKVIDNTNYGAGQANGNNNDGSSDFYYFVYASMSQSDTDKFTFGTGVSSSVYSQIAVGGQNKIHITAKSVTGSANITFGLYRSATQPIAAGDLSKANTLNEGTLVTSQALPTDARLIDSKTYTWYNVDKKDITSYEIQSLDSALYAMKDTEDKRTGTNQKNKLNYLASDASDTYRYDTNYAIKDTSFGEYLSDCFVKGKYNGMTVELNPADILSYSVSDPNKFGFILEAATNTAKVSASNIVKFDGDKKVFAKYVDDKPYTGNVTAVVRGYNNVTQTTSAAINSKPSDTDRATPASIAIDMPDPGAVKAVSGITPFTDSKGKLVVMRPFLKYGSSGDIYKVSVTNANFYLAGRRIIRYNISATDPFYYGHKNEITDPKLANDAVIERRAGIYFLVKDQYGKSALAPSNIIATVEKADGTAATITATYDSATGILTASGAFSDGDVLNLTAFTGNGLSKAIKIYVVADGNVDYSHAHQ